MLLDHESTQMTAHYARITDQTVRRRWEQATKVNVKGERVSIDPDGPLAQAQWAKTRYGIATQTLPHGYCGLPVQKSCPHANACLTCPVFLTGPEFLPELREHRGRTLTLIDNARANGHTRVAEMNTQVLANLDRMIGEVETTRPEQPMPADNSRPPARRRPTTRRADPPPRRRRAPTHGRRRRPDHLRRRRPRGRRLPVLALHPARPARRDRTAARPPPPALPNPVPPDRQRASDASLLRRLQAATERIHRLEDDNRQLREALAEALGERRTADILGHRAGHDTPEIANPRKSSDPLMKGEPATSTTPSIRQTCSSKP